MELKIHKANPSSVELYCTYRNLKTHCPLVLPSSPCASPSSYCINHIHSKPEPQFSIQYQLAREMGFDTSCMETARYDRTALNDNTARAAREELTGELEAAVSIKRYTPACTLIYRT